MKYKCRNNVLVLIEEVNNIGHFVIQTFLNDGWMTNYVKKFYGLSDYDYNYIKFKFKFIGSVLDDTQKISTIIVFNDIETMNRFILEKI